MIIDFEFVKNNIGKYECEYEPTEGEFPYSGKIIENKSGVIFYNGHQMTPDNIKTWSEWKDYAPAYLDKGVRKPVTFKQLEEDVSINIDIDSMIVNEWFDIHLSYCDTVIELLKKGQGFSLKTEEYMLMFVELAFITSEEIGAKGVVITGNSPWFVKLVF